MIQWLSSHRLRRTLIGPPLVLVAVFGIVGCFTVLKHPVTAQEGPERVEHPQEYYRQNCLDCHEDYATYPYGYFYGSYPEYYFEYPRWGYYYAYPWWWENHWYEDDGSYNHGEVEGARGVKSARRGGLVPPYVKRAPALNTGSVGGSYRSPTTSTPTQKGTQRSERGVPGSVRTGTKKRVIVTGETDNGDNSEPVTKTESKSTKTKRRGGGPPK